MSIEFGGMRYAEGISEMVDQEVRSWGIVLTAGERQDIRDAIYRTLNAAVVRQQRAKEKS